jgi:hypothetical protein
LRLSRSRRSPARAWRFFKLRANPQAELLDTLRRHHLMDLIESGP